MWSLCTQNSDLRSRNNDLKQQLEGAWKLVGELHEQLAIPAANRDPATVGRVKQQVRNMFFSFGSCCRAALLCFECEHADVLCSYMSHRHSPDLDSVRQDECIPDG